MLLPQSAVKSYHASADTLVDWFLNPNTIYPREG